MVKSEDKNRGKWWQREYLPDFREFHKCKTGSTGRGVQEGEVVTVQGREEER